MIDPERPGRYVLGIECDGAAYHSTRAARERDRLRQDVLELLGWRIHRIWSTDWWHDDRGRQLAKLQAAIEAAVEGAGDDVETPPPAAPEAAPPVAPLPEITEEQAERVVEQYGSKQRKTMPSAFQGGKPYEPFVLDPHLGSPDDFYLDRSAFKVGQQIRAVIQAEGPLSGDTLMYRLSESWDIRVTKRFRQRVQGLLDAVIRAGEVVLKDGFLWPTSLEPADYKVFRMPLRDSEARRDAGDIPPEEIANAAAALLKQGGATPEESLVRDVARLFGFSRVGNRVEAAVATGLEMLVVSERASMRDGRYFSA